MNKNITNYLTLEEELKKITHLGNLAAIMHWDSAVNLAPKSAPNRQKEMATFAGLIHEIFSSQTIGDLIKKAEEEQEYLDQWQQANLKLCKKNYDNATIIPSKLQQEYTQASAECEFVWRTAKKENDFNKLAPYLEKLVKQIQKIAKMKSEFHGKSAYDCLIDNYDPDRTSNEIRNVFDQLKAKLPGIITKITAKQAKEKVIPLSKKIDKNTIKAINLKLIENMQFDMQAGRLDESIHPFSIGSNTDTRLTTKYDEDNFLFTLLCTVHETGHGLYTQNLPDKYRNHPVGSYLGMSFHESQSLIMEQAASSKAFMNYLAKLLHDDFSFKGEEYSAENLYRLVNKVQQNFIRIRSDEVTYMFHIIIRFEIEEKILNDSLEIKDLPEYWNSKMQEYLGILPKTDSDGCLQDIHWPSGALGYFPSYANGTIIASMMRKAAEKENDITTELKTGSFNSLNNYLTKNFRSYGSLRSSKDTLHTATGYKDLQPDIFLDYVKNKYL
ncbi:MAG: carboxypeptidase M32 [Rickettsiaceae bacterium]|nr:carboxypeptidase M32 [Rickettsiaceae bacterium]